MGVVARGLSFFLPSGLTTHLGFWLPDAHSWRQSSSLLIGLLGVLVASAGGGTYDNNGELCKFLADFVVLASVGEARQTLLPSLTYTISCSIVLNSVISRKEIMSIGIALLVISVGYILRQMFDTPPDMHYDIWEDEIYYE